MDEPQHEPGVEFEPHLAHAAWQRDETENSAGKILDRAQQTVNEIDRVDHTVWDEPALASGASASRHQPDRTYNSWLAQNIERTTWLDTWSVTLVVALAAGPWGVLGAVLAGFWSGGTTGIALLAAVVFGPVTEEITKVAAALWVVEKRPFCFRSASQILICAACGGLAFAVIENLIYMYVYVPEHTPQFVAFRWTVCLALHVSCSTLAGLGLERIWNDSITNLRRPNLTLGTRWFVAAMVCHGLYNLSVSLAETAGWLDFGLPSSGA